MTSHSLTAQVCVHVYAVGFLMDVTNMGSELGEEWRLIAKYFFAYFPE